MSVITQANPSKGWLSCFVLPASHLISFIFYETTTFYLMFLSFIGSWIWARQHKHNHLAAISAKY
jgi:hypothetical protein